MRQKALYFLVHYAAVANHTSRGDAFHFSAADSLWCALWSSQGTSKKAHATVATQKTRAILWAWKWDAPAAANNKKDEDMQRFEQQRHYKQIITFGHQQDAKNKRNGWHKYCGQIKPSNLSLRTSKLGKVTTWWWSRWIHIFIIFHLGFCTNYTCKLDSRLQFWLVRSSQKWPQGIFSFFFKFVCIFEQQSI